MCSSRSTRAPRSRFSNCSTTSRSTPASPISANEPLGRVNALPLYHERYRLLTSADAPLGNRDTVTWAEVAQVPLCLLTPDMQNRRIIDRLLKSAGGESRPTLESDSMILLFSHVRTGRWASVMPAKLAETLGLTDTLRAIPIVEPEAVQTIGLVVPSREPMMPNTAALVAEARRLAPMLEMIEAAARRSDQDRQLGIPDALSRNAFTQKILLVASVLRGASACAG